MRFGLGFLAGLGTAWAVLAIWQRLPGLDDDPAVATGDWVPPPDVYEYEWTGRPGYSDSVAGGA